MEGKHITLRIQCDSKAKIDFGVRQANDDIQTNIVCDDQKTTCFTEAATIVESKTTECSVKAPTKIHAEYDTIKDFLGKPYMLGQFTWVAGNLTGTALITPFSIGALLTSVTQWEIKRRGFNLIRGTFVFRLEVNANPFQAASALIYYLPNYAHRVAFEPEFAKRMNINLVQKFQHPCLHFDLRDTCAIFKVPYIAPTPYYDVKAAEIDWGHIFMDVVSPLATGVNGNLGAEVSYFGYWEDVEFGAPMIPQSSNKSRRTKDREEKELVTLTPIASGLKSAADTIGLGAIVPWLAPVCTDVSWALNMLSNFALAFGWSKPRINETPVVVAHQECRYLCTSDGPDTSMPVALFSNNALKVSSEYSITDEDEMTLRFLLSVPTYAGIKQWLASTATSDTPIYSTQLVPIFMYGTDAGLINSITQTDTGHVATYRTGAPLYYLSNFFSYYRGSMKVKIRVIKTIYHSGRLLITWNPITTVAVAPTRTSSIYSLRQILDIREQEEIELTLPYMINSPYVRVNQSMGTLDIFILNSLKCPETCAQSVDLEIFYQAGDDFEFQVHQATDSLPSGIYTPQSSSVSIFKGGIANSDVQTVDTMHTQRSIGEHFASIKQLLNRANFQQPLVTALLYATKSIALYPWYIYGASMVAGGATINRGPYCADMFSFLAPMYNYFRGGVRFRIQTENGAYISAVNIPNYHSANYGPVSTKPIDFAPSMHTGINFPVADTLAISTSPCAVVPGSEKGTCFAHFPYYSRFPVMFPIVWGSPTGPAQLSNPLYPRTNALFTSNVDFGTGTTLSRSFADDFQLCFFIGCPPMYLVQT